jgi:competence protein ComEA
VTSSDPAPPRARARLGAGAVVVIVLLALAVTAGIGMLRTTGAPEVLPVGVATDAASGPSVTDGRIFVHVSGAVAEPGLYQLAAGARLFDAAAAAGGLRDDADAAAVNLARTVEDGEQVHVPAVGEAPPPAASGGGPIGAAGGKIDLNTADVAALDGLPRIGPAIAQRIIDWRQANGRFTSVEDLLGVPGIGDKMLAALRDLVTV